MLLFESSSRACLSFLQKRVGKILSISSVVRTGDNVFKHTVGG